MPRHNKMESVGKNAVRAIIENEFGWIVREVPTDRGIDLETEICVDGNATGRIIALQVKSGSSYFSRPGRNGYVFRIDDDHYKYWKGYSVPCILVLHEPNRNLTIWQSLDENSMRSTGKGWKVHLSSKQVLSESSRRRLEKLADPCPRREVSLLESKIQDLDPRFDLKIETHGKDEIWHIRALENTVVTFEFKGNPKELEPKLRDLLESGKPVTFPDEEISFPDAPILEQLKKDCPGGLTVRHASSHELELVISLVDAKGSELARLDGIVGEFIMGGKHGCMKAELPDSPISIELDGFPKPIDTVSGTSTNEFSIKFDRGKWEGKPLSKLPHLDTLQRFFNKFSNRCDVRVIFRQRGIDAAKSENTNIDALFENWKNYVLIIDKAREIASRYNLDPLLPVLTSEDVENIEFAYSILTTGSFRTNFSRRRITVPLVPNDSFDTLAAKEPMQLLLMGKESSRFDFLGYEIDLGMLRISYSKASVADREELTSMLRERLPGEAVDVTWETAQDCERHIEVIVPAA